MRMRKPSLTHHETTGERRLEPARLGSQQELVAGERSLSVIPIPDDNIGHRFGVVVSVYESAWKHIVSLPRLEEIDLYPYFSNIRGSRFGGTPS